jgi:hypothetical protein
MLLTSIGIFGLSMSVGGLGGLVFTPFFGVAFILFVIFAISASTVAIRSGIRPPRSKGEKIAVTIVIMWVTVIILWILYGMLGILFSVLRY